MKIDFDTTNYEFTHGRKPKGWGMWAFEYRDGLRWSEPVWVTGSMTYAEAKKHFKAIMAARAPKGFKGTIWARPCT